MRHTTIATLALLVCTASPASADLGMTMTMSMNAGGMAVNATMETRVKALKMRSDIKMMQQDMSIFLDAAARRCGRPSCHEGDHQHRSVGPGGNFRSPLAKRS